MEASLMDKVMALLPKIAMWYAAIHVAITAIAVATPTKKDDKIKSILDKLGKVFDRIGIQIKSPK